MPGHLKGRASLETKVDEAVADISSKETRVRDLQATVTSSRPIIDRINRLLDSVGFDSFSLAESTEVPDGYTLVRANGEVAAETLSEGERTFITFLYFAQSLQGAPQDAAEPNDLLVVIDDPISSLDSDVLYAVSTIIRAVIAGISDGTGRAKQLVVLTHNAHFHKEVTYARRGDPTAGWQYGLIKKRSGLPSTVELSQKNPIQTAYAALWDEVRRAAQDPTGTAVGIQNALRRILETYFKVLANVDDTEIIEKFNGDERLICQSLLSWVNAGSHWIFDALEFSPTIVTVEAYLQVFRRIFEEQGQIGHYLMMMGDSVDSSTVASSGPGGS